MTDKLVTIASHLTAQEAHLAKNSLESEGIPAVLADEETENLLGLVVGFATLVPVVLAELFGLKRFGTLSGLLGMASALAMAIGPMVVGVVFDATNSYTTAFELSAMLCFLAAASAFALSPIAGIETVSPEALRSLSRH